MGISLFTVFTYERVVCPIKDEHRTSNAQHRILNEKRRNQENWFRFSLRVSKRLKRNRNSKQMKLNCGAQRHHYSMFNVGRSSFKPTPYGIDATREHLQNNLVLIGVSPRSGMSGVYRLIASKISGVPFWKLSKD